MVSKHRLPDFDFEERLAEFDGFAVFDEDFLDDAFDLGLDFVHHLHGFNDADDGLGRDGGAFLDERFAVGRGGAVEGADHRCV